MLQAPVTSEIQSAVTGRVAESTKPSPEAITWERVHRDVQTLSRRRAKDDAIEMRLIVEVDRLAVWRRTGCVTLLAYVERELGHAPKVGRERIRVARALVGLPELAQCLATGELSYSVVRELTRVATQETVAAWIQRALGRPAREIEEMVKQRSVGSRPEDPPDLAPGPSLLSFEDVAPEAHAIVREARRALENELGHAVDDSTFVRIAFGAILEPRTIGEPGAGVHRPSHQIAITECRCGRAWQQGGGRKFPIDAAALDRAKCDATFIGSLDTDDVQRARSDIPPAIRRLVLQRDGYACTYPGCRSTRFLDLHHIRHQEHGGGNQPSNITTLCDGHHGFAHHGMIEVKGTAPDALQFSEPRARLVAEEVGDRELPVVSSLEMSVDEWVVGTGEHMDDERAMGPVDVAGELPSSTNRGSERPSDRSRGVGSVEEAVVGVADEQVASIEARPSREPVIDRRPRGHVASHVTRYSKSKDVVEAPGPDGASLRHAEIEGEVRQALVTAGFSLGEAREAISKAMPHVGHELRLETLLREALRRCSRRR